MSSWGMTVTAAAAAPIRSGSRLVTDRPFAAVSAATASVPAVAPEFLLTDIAMPGVEGYALLRHVVALTDRPPSGPAFEAFLAETAGLGERRHMVLRTGSCLVDSAPGGARRSRPADWRCRAGAAFLVRFAASNDSRTALGGSGGLHVPESLHLDVPNADV